MTSFTSTLAREFPLSDDEQEVLQLAHRWVGVYFRMMNENGFHRMPEPKGTMFEAWSIVNMVTMFWGMQMYPAMQVRMEVPLSLDYFPRVVALKQRLELAPSAEGECLGRSLSQ
jgi:hypothetical protein